MSTETTERNAKHGPKAESARARLRSALAGDEPATVPAKAEASTDEPVSTEADQARARLRAALGPAEEKAAETSSTDGAEDAPARRRRLRLPRSKRMRIISALVLVVLLLGTGGFFVLKSGRSLLGLQSGEGVLSFLPTWLPSGVAFEYGDRRVSTSELDSEVDTLHALYGVQVPTDQGQLGNFRKDAAKAYAVSLILDHAAADNGIVIADKTARDTLSKFVAEKLGNGPDAYNKFVAALGEQGTTEQAVVDELKRRLALAQLFDKLTADVPAVSDQDVTTAFEQRKATLGTPEKRAVSNIVVQSQADANKVVTALRGGTPFAEEAKQVSLDGSTRDKGGDLGTVSKDQLDAGYGDAAFKAKPGEVFGPVQNQYGWNVGLVGQVTAATPADFAQAKEPLRQQLLTERALDKWRTWLGGQIRAAGVRYADDYRPADPDAAPGNAPTQAGIPASGGGK
ncbi:peptidyl-prolyl cis-trans isomerase [Amycolatopsis echigonensis]|nr:peptidyl-prolyl cis-trans isomerase [Amycolatopsis echigonensis]